MRQVQGLEIVEVAAALDVSESTVKREVVKARRAIVARAKRSEPLLWEYIRRIEEEAHG
jgi:DNA-directed RNA polymerase specialized sigma24 family protein